jgi:hypothetical protein
MIRSRTLFMLDMTIFESMDPPTASSSTRFSPSTLTLFELDVTNATFIPFLIRVSDGRNTQVYCGPLIPVVTGFATPSFTPTVASTSGAWLYALQALKASTTCWGIWLGHVYRYHIVSTAMQMTMYQRLPPLHPVRQILGRQSKHTIGFDAVLLTVWSFPPPTSCGTSIEFLQLINEFAKGRPFGIDDPEAALSLYEQAMMEVEEAGHWSDVGAICRNWANALRDVGRLDDARSTYLRSARAKARARAISLSSDISCPPQSTRSQIEPLRES